MIYYKQCKLVRNSTMYTAWIPEEFAKLGKYVKIKMNGEWVDGWCVTEIGSRETEEHVLDRERDYKHQREVSDI